MERQGNKSKKLNFEEMMEMIKKEPVVWEFINKNYHCSKSQSKLLGEIFEIMSKAQEAGEGEKQDRLENLRERIYLYGSLAKGRDFIARQMFLWFLEILEQF